MNDLEKPKQKRPNRSAAMKPHPAPGDNTKFLTNTLAMLDWKQPNLANPPEVAERVRAYFTLCAQNDVRPSVEGLALAFNVNRRALYNWIHTDRTKSLAPESKEYLLKAYNAINAMLVDYMQNGKINPISGIFLMKNNYDYEDKKQITVAPVNPMGDETPPEELRRKYLETLADD